MNTVNLRLIKASPSFATKSERIPSDYFDPLARRRSEIKVAMMLVDCLNSYIKNPLFFRLFSPSTPSR
jgi:hypothetical protein